MMIRIAAAFTFLPGFLLLSISASVYAADYRAHLKVSPKSYQGSCPKKFIFYGTISSIKATRLQYKFIRSDGTNTPVKILVFTKPGIKRVQTNWTLGDQHRRRWQAIQIVYPQKIVSNRAYFSLLCKAPQKNIRTKKTTMSGVRFKPKTVKTRKLTMTGVRFKPKTVITQKLTMTGVRFKPKTVKTQKLTMTGVRFKPKTVKTRKLTMTGVRFKPKTVITQKLTMTGVRFKPKTVKTQKLTMTGIRRKLKAIKTKAANPGFKR